MMKSDFNSILKALLILKTLKFFFIIFSHVEFKKQLKRNEIKKTMKYANLIEYNMRNIFVCNFWSRRFRN